MPPQSFQFQAQTESTSGIQSTWVMKSYDQTVKCAIPPEFNGPGGGLSPEDLYVQALSNCFLATFKVYAENSKLIFNSIHIHSNLKVEQNEFKKTVMKSCHFELRMTGVQQKEKAELLVKKAFESGFILNSVKTELSYHLEFEFAQ